MKKLIFVAVVSILAGCAGKQQRTFMSDPMFENIQLDSVTNIWSHRVTHKLPKGWKPVYSKQSGPIFIQEFVHRKETKENWNGMFTVTGMKGLAAQRDAKNVAFAYTQALKRLCADDSIFIDLGEKKVGDYPGYQLITGCAKSPDNLPIGLKKGNSELIYTHVVTGGQDMYVFQKSLRGGAFNKNTPPVNKENVNAFLDGLFPLSLCHRNSVNENNCQTLN